MTRDRRPGFTHQWLSFLLAAVAVMSLAACSDGYPTEDAPQIDPAGMTQAQLLAALNAMGKEPHLGRVEMWRGGCRSEHRCWPPLSVDGALKARPWLRFHIPLIELDVRY
jgi:hypothetical protein